MTNEKLYCGIDIHSKKSYFCFMNISGEIREHREINTKKEEVEAIIEKYKDNKISYAFEAGGMARYLHKIINKVPNTDKIHVVHPLKFKIITESKRKNDKEDSKKLAIGLLKEYLPYPVHIKSEKSRQLQVLLNLRASRIRNRTRIINQVKAILRELGIKRNSSNLRSRNGFKESITLLREYNFERGIVMDLYEEYISQEEKIKQGEKMIKEIVVREYKRENELLLTIPGIGFVAAATIISVIDTISRFENAGQLSSYCGLVPSEHSSGEKITHGRITKEGSKMLRTILIQCAWAMLRTRHLDDIRIKKLKKKFYRLGIRHKNYQRAITAVARHLSRIVFGVLKHKEVYS